MKSYNLKPLLVALGATTLAAAACGVSAAQPTSFDWQVVVNNGDTIPTTTRVYNSYNPPSVNSVSYTHLRAHETS